MFSAVSAIASRRALPAERGSGGREARWGVGRDVDLLAALRARIFLLGTEPTVFGGGPIESAFRRFYEKLHARGFAGYGVAKGLGEYRVTRASMFTYA